MQVQRSAPLPLKIKRYGGKFTLGILLLRELESKMVVRIVVILSDILAGTAVGVMKNVHQDNTTRITSGTYTAEM